MRSDHESQWDGVEDLKPKNKEIKLFSYGSIILPEMMQKTFGFTPIPEQSVFINRHRLKVEHAKSKKISQLPLYSL